MSLLRRASLVSLVAALSAMSACGKKGPPLAPLRPVPAAVDTLAARRLGDTVRVEFVVPSRNADGSSPADITRVEVYGLTYDRGSRPPALDDFLAAGTLVGSIDVRPPPDRDERTPAQAGRPADPRHGQGETAVLFETLTPELGEPVELGPGRTAPTARTLAALTPGGAVRAYLALAFSRRDHRSAPSSPATAPVWPAGPAPIPAIRYTETAFTVSWPPLPPDPWQPVWPLLKFGRGMNVYDVPADSLESPLAPVNAEPVDASTLDVPLEAFGVPRCFALRVVETRHAETVESPLSAPVCETPVDTFPPAAPTGLAAVAGGGAISLIWDASSERDVAGYRLLRGEAPGATLRALTPEPIRETTYRDTDVRPGVRYVYVVVAVDTATPPNHGPQSARVEETAR